MSQKQETIQPNLRNRWQRLSIRTKLLVPIVFGMAVALIIVLIGLQRPIDSLSEKAVQEAFHRHTKTVQDDAVVVLEQLQSTLSDISIAEPVESVASGIEGATDQAQRSQITDKLGSYLQTKLASANLPFESLRYLDGNGQQLAYAVVTNDAQGNAIQSALRPAQELQSEGKLAYFSNILLLPPLKGLVLPLISTSNNPAEGLIQIAVPVYRQGIPVGAVVGNFHLKSFAQSVFPRDEAGKFRTLLVQGDGTVIAAADYGNSGEIVVYGETLIGTYSAPNEMVDGKDHAPIALGQRLYSALTFEDEPNAPKNNWLVVSSQDANAAFADGNSLKLALGAALALLFALITAAVAFVSGAVTRPLMQVSSTANRIASGSLAGNIPVDSDDEVGSLASAFNTMNDRLNTVVTSLEKRVALRSRNIEIVAEISRDAAQLRDIDVLLQRSVNAIRDRFDFYHAQVFLLDEAGQNAVLVTSTGEAGRLLLERKHKLAVGSDSIIGQVTQKGRTFITLDTQKSDVPHRFNALLPRTRSEMALPLRVADNVIGALDIQSVEPDAFGEDDIQIFQVLADQLAIAINNARLFTESETRLQQVADLNRQLTRSAWSEFVDEENPAHLGFEYDLLEVKPSPEPNGKSVASADIKVRGETVGSISVGGANTELSEDDKAILQAVADRVSLAIENARLVEQTRNTLNRIEHLYQASRTLGSAGDLENVFTITAEQLAGFEFIDRVVVLTPRPDPIPDPQYYETLFVWERLISNEEQFQIGARMSSQPILYQHEGGVLRRPRVLNVESGIPGATGVLLNLPAIGIHSLMVAPIATTTRWFGVLVAYSSQHVQSFNANFMQFVSAMLDQVAVAIENQYLLETVQSEARRNRALAEAAQISSQIGIDFEQGISDLFKAVAGPAHYDRWWFGQLVNSPAGQALARVTSHFEDGSPLHHMSRIYLENEQNTIAEATRLDEWVLVNDPADHHALSGLSREKARAFGKHIAVPVRLSEMTVGTLMVGRELTETNLDDRDVQLVITLASQITIVLENRRLFTNAEAERQTLQAVINSLPTGVVVYDAQTQQLTLTNDLARDLLGLDEDIPFERIHTVSGVPYAEDEDPAKRVLRSSEPIFSEDMSLIRPTGERVELFVNAAPVFDADGKLISAVAVYQDVTELRELENVLQESLRETTSLYETSRAIAAETDLIRILSVVANQITTALNPALMLTLFRDEEGEISQIYGADTSGIGGVTQLEGAIPVPETILLEDDLFTETDVSNNPTLANDTRLKALGIQSIGAFPLNVRSRVIGWLVIGFDTNKGFSPEERRFLGTLTDQAAIAAENARLAQQTAQALNETTLLYEASYTINRATSIEDALDVMRDELKFFAPTQIDIFLTVTKRDASSVDWVLHWNANDAIVGGASLTEGKSVEDATFIDADPYFLDNLSNASDEELELINSLPYTDKFTAQASVPLNVAGRSSGRLVVSFNRYYRFGRLERQFLTTLADQAAVVINNSMLVQQTQESLEETGTLYQSSREITNAENLTQVLKAIIDHATPPNVNRATLIRLIGDSWDAPGASIEIGSNWDADTDNVIDLTGTRFTQEQYPAWNEISSPEVLWIEDVTTDEQVTEASRNLHRGMGVTSVVTVPLVVAGKPIGALVLTSMEPWSRTEREGRIYSSLADQAAIYIENRNLLAQTERRARQLQISAQIAQAASSILDLDQLFDQTVDLIKASFAYDHAQIFLITPDGTDARLVASTGEAGQQLLGIQHHLFVGSQSIIGQVTATGVPQIVRDTSAPDSVHKPNRFLPNTRAEMALALRAREHIVGALDVQSNRAGAFTEEDVAVLSILADQIAVAIDNARLFEVSTKRMEEMRFLFDVTRVATGAEETGEAMQRITEMVTNNLKAAGSVIFLLDETGTQLQQFGASLTDASLAEPSTTELNNPVFQRLSRDRQPIILSDIPADMQSYLPGMGSAVLVPLLSGENFVGMIGATKTEPNGFSEDSVQLLQTLSSTLGAIIQNNRLLIEVQAANTRLREVDKLKSQFLANMSHELRTPLNSIIGFSRVILKGIDGPLSPMQEQDLSTIHESGKHLLNLVNDILDQAKIEAGKMELSYGMFSMAELIKSVMSTAIGLVKDKPVRLHQEIEADLPSVWGDEFRSRQVLLNLVSNAAKFTAQGSVTVSAFKMKDGDQDMVQVSVTDTGIGIPEDKIDAIFEAFQQAENTTARQYEGTGLGLPIARSLVEMQGGKMSVFSETGVGSTFSFTSPINPPQPETVEGEEAPAVDSQLANQVVEALDHAEQPKPNQRIILAIDDEIGMVNLYRRYLARSGYEVIGGQAPEAEELAINYQPRLILLDVNMPSRSGWDVLEHLKDRDETFEIPVIVCSIDEDKERAFRLGAADYLVKSIDERTLIEAVKRVELERDRRKVVIIDDQPESIRMVRDALAADERFSVLEAIGGEQGLDVVNNHWPDLIILDLRMPNMDGFEVLDHLRANDDTAKIPVMVITADDLTDVERQRLNGTWLYQKQTVDPQDLLNNIVAQISW